MNKNILKTALLVFATGMILSCNDNFLERYPLDELSNETYWTSENDLMVYNNSIYDLSRNDDQNAVLMGHDSKFNSTRASYQYFDEWTDNLAPLNSRANMYKDIRAGIHQPQGGARSFGYRAWDFLRAINVGLDNYDRAEGKVARNVIDMYVGEARLFRGWFYYDKVSKFGDVQYIDHELNINSPELYSKRAPRDSVMQLVLADINFAVEKLPYAWSQGGDPGRLNKWFALMLNLRVCLFEGTWQKYHGGTNANMWLQEAADAAKQIIDNGPFSLYTTNDTTTAYNALHRLQDLTGNPEIIYWIKYETGVRDNNIMKYYVDYSGGATKNMVEDYLCADGLPISLSPLYKGDDVLEDVFENRDPRLRQTVLYPADQSYYQYNINDSKTYPRFSGMGGIQGSTGYHVIKTYVSSVHGGAHNSGTTPGIVFRLAETYLNYAEARAELGTITQADLDITINKLRDRVHMKHLTTTPAMDPRYANDGVSALLVEIRRERRVELFSEGFRYDDLRRWKQGKKLEVPAWGIQWNDAAIARFQGAKVNTAVDPVSGKTYIDVYKGTNWANPVFDESKHYLWPIPLNAMTENPNLKQTVGW